MVTPRYSRGPRLATRNAVALTLPAGLDRVEDDSSGRQGELSRCCWGIVRGLPTSSAQVGPQKRRGSANVQQAVGRLVASHSLWDN